MRVRLPLTAACLLACLSVPSATSFVVFAEPVTQTVFGSVRGLVHDAQHRPVAGASVTLRARASEWSRQTTSDTSGEYRFDAVPVGEYLLDFRLAGFDPAELAVTVLSDKGPVVHVQLQVAGLTASVNVSANPETASPPTAGPVTLVSRNDITTTPGASRTNSLAMVTAFVPGAYVTHDQLHVRGGHQVSWLVDGVPVPNTNIASNVGPQFDPKDADYLEVHRGAYDAGYGDRTYAVFNIVPRSGFERDNEAEIVASGGSYFQTNDQFSVGGHSARLAYYGSLTGNRSDLGLETPTADVIHDRQAGLAAFGTLFFNPDPRNQLRLVASARRDSYQVPNTPEDQAAGRGDVERESDGFVNMSWVRSFSSGALLTVSPFVHRNTAEYDGGGDIPMSTTVRQQSTYAGAQTTLGASAGRHHLQGGFYGFWQQDEQVFAQAFTDASRASFAQQAAPNGSLAALFVQDSYEATTWLTVTGGVRHTRFSGALVENATSPRIGATVRWPRLGWTFRGFYGRFYQAPPLMTVSGPLLDFVTAEDLAVIPLHGERDEEYQVGVVVPVRGWVLDGDVFRTSATNYFDHNSVGNSNVFIPVTIDGALIRGTELTLRSPRAWHVAQIHVAYANQIAEGRGGVSGGLTDFSPPPGRFLLDHDQRHTLSVGINAMFPHAVSAGAQFYYGSGFPDEGGPARLEPQKTFDLMGSKAFGERLSLAITALNVTNRRVLMDNSPTFGGTHFNSPRELFVELRYRFHY